MKVLTLKTAENTEIEIHMLNPREHMPDFGGSRSGLVVGKTASLITRTLQAGTRTDVERNIDDKFIWDFIARCVNGAVKAEATAAQETEG